MRINQQEVSQLSLARMNQLLTQVETDLGYIFAQQANELGESFQTIALYESGFEVNLLNETVKGFDAVLPAPDQVMAAVNTSIMSVRGVMGGRLLDSFVEYYEDREIEAFKSHIRIGFGEGQTNAQIIRNVREELKSTKVHTDAMVRTAIQHVSTQSRTATLKENGFKKYQWVSTLDSRTTPICMKLDNQIFSYKKGPLPPAHIRCRSTTVPVLPKEFDIFKEGATRSSVNGQVSQDLDYFDFLKTQSKQFQIDALGKARAELFQSMNKTKFISLSYGKRFEPLTLDEMRKKEPTIFNRLDL